MLLRGCPDFWAGDGGRALVAWLHQSGGLSVEGGAKLVPVPSAIRYACAGEAEPPMVPRVHPQPIVQPGLCWKGLQAFPLLAMAPATTPAMPAPAWPADWPARQRYPLCRRWCRRCRSHCHCAAAGAAAVVHFNPDQRVTHATQDRFADLAATIVPDQS